MFDDIRQQFFSTELIPGITARYIEDRSAFWTVTVPMMDRIFVPFPELGLYQIPDERREQLEPLRDVFARTHHERFILYNEAGEAVGWSYGEMLDYETFFMTSSGILPEYRQRGIYTAFLRRLLRYLAALGYERVTSNHQTNNAPVIIAKLKVGFVIRGVNLDERWGAQVELAYFFHDDRRRGYARAFALEQRDGSGSR
jgi:GNAT superfamily N-acetyltransferase